MVSRLPYQNVVCLAVVLAATPPVLPPSHSILSQGRAFCVNGPLPRLPFAPKCCVVVLGMYLKTHVPCFPHVRPLNESSNCPDALSCPEPPLCPPCTPVPSQPVSALLQRPTSILVDDCTLLSETLH